jgi:hypothetical protein
MALHLMQPEEKPGKHTILVLLQAAIRSGEDPEQMKMKGILQLPDTIIMEIRDEMQKVVMYPVTIIPVHQQNQIITIRII